MQSGFDLLSKILFESDEDGDDETPDLNIDTSDSEDKSSEQDSNEDAPDLSINTGDNSDTTNGGEDNDNSSTTNDDDGLQDEGSDGSIGSGLSGSEDSSGEGSDSEETSGIGTDDENSDSSVADDDKLKTQLLSRNFIKLYEIITKSIEKFNNIESVTVQERDAVLEYTSNLIRIRDILEDYMANKFKTNPYPLNLYNYINFENSVQLSIKMVKNVLKLRLQAQTN